MAIFNITIKANVCDPEYFEQYFIILKVFLENYEKYSYSVEHDDTIDRHLHLIIETPDRDWNSLFEKLKKKAFKSIIQNIPPSTILKTFINGSKVKETQEDIYKVLGYVNKWHCNRRAHKGWTEADILDAVEFYTTQAHHEKTQIKTDVKIVTTKNIYAMTSQFCKDTGTNVDDPLIRLKMTKSKYGFVNVSPNNISRAFKELRIMDGVESHGDHHDIALEIHGIETKYDQYQQETIKELCHFLQQSNIDPDEIPTNIRTIITQNLI